MVQINDTSTIQDEGKGQRAFKTFLRYLWTILLLLGALLAFGNERLLGGVAFLIAAATYFFLLNSIAWNIGNTIRKWIMPEAFLGANAMDAFKQKVFWNIGPQWFATMFTWGILYFALNALTDADKPNVAADRKTPVVTPVMNPVTESPALREVQIQPPIRVQETATKDSEQPIQQVNDKCLEYKGDDPIVKQRLGCP